MQLDSQKQQEQKSKGRPDAAGVSFRSGEAQRTCPKCGAQVGAADRFCEECGALLSSAESLTSEQTPRTSAPALTEEEQLKAVASVPEEKKNTITEAKKTDEQKKADRPQGLPIIDLGKLSLDKSEKSVTPAIDTKIVTEHKSTVSNSANLPKLGLTEQVERQRKGWICNFCGCYHNEPSECSRPDLGGRWQYKETKTIAITIIK